MRTTHRAREYASRLELRAGLRFARLVASCQRIHAAAVAELGVDLGGGSVLDLVADHLPGARLEELRRALRLAGLRQ